MSEFVQIEDQSRRDWLRRLALSITAIGGALDLDAAQAVHHAAAAEKKSGPYKPKAFNEHEIKTIGRLAELIVPADDISGSAKDAGTVEFIDLLSSQNEQLARIFTGGIAWLDREMGRRDNAKFVDAPAARQTAMLDALVAAEAVVNTRRAEEASYSRSGHYKDFATYTKAAGSDLAPGVLFFDWIRRMSVDAFYTSPIGIKDIGFLGNGAHSKYAVPAEAIEYAMSRSPLGKA